MTKEQALDRIDVLGQWAATALKTAAHYESKEWGAEIAATFRSNAGCYNQSAGLLAADGLHIATLLIDRDRLTAHRRAA